MSITDENYDNDRTRENMKKMSDLTPEQQKQASLLIKIGIALVVILVGYVIYMIVR